MTKVSFGSTPSSQMINIILLNTLVNFVIASIIRKTESPWMERNLFATIYDSDNGYQLNTTKKVNTVRNAENNHTTFQDMDIKEVKSTSSLDVMITSKGSKFLQDSTGNETELYSFIRYPLELGQLNQEEYHIMVTLGICLIMIYTGIIISALLRNVISNFHLSIGIQAPLLLYGIVIGVCFRLSDEYFVTGTSLHRPHNLLKFLAVPLMLYRACLCIDLHEIRKIFFQALVISVPGLLANAILVGVAMRYVLDVEWNFGTCMFFGTACVFIYPHQNIQMMRQLNLKSQQIAILLEGEFIIGTMSSFALYILWFSGEITSLSPYYVVLGIIRYFSGFLVGYLTGLLNYYSSWTLSSNLVDMLLFCTITPLIVFYLCFNFLKVSGIIAISISGLMMSSERIVASKSSNIIIRDYWQFSSIFVDTVVLTTVGFSIGWSHVWFSESFDYVHIVLMYCITYFGRFVILTILSPLSNKLGYNVDSRSRILAVCGGIPSLINICYTLLPISIKEIDTDVKPSLFFYVSGMVIISLFLNVISLPHLLTFLKMDLISVSREEELRLCMGHLHNRKKRELFFMKIESLMGETDWALVQSVASLDNPYSEKSWVHGDDHTNQTTRYCPDCHNEIVVPLSYAQYPERRAATYLRILKMREAMQVKMFSQNLLSRKSYMALKGVLRDAYDHPNNYLQSDDILKKFDIDLSCSNSYLKKYRKWLLFRFKETEIRRPNFYWRRLCYHMIRSKDVHMIIFCVLLVNIIFILTEGFLNPKPISKLKHTFTFFDAVFMMVYTTEWLVNIAGRARTTFWRNGFKEYLRQDGCLPVREIWPVRATVGALKFLDYMYRIRRKCLSSSKDYKSPFNIFDFIVLVTVWISFLIETLCYFDFSSELFLYENRIFFTLFKAVRILRLIKFLKYAQTIVTRIKKKYEDEKLITAYDIGKDFLIQEKKMLNSLPIICNSYRLSQDLREDIERNLFKIVHQLYNVESKFSWISTTVKTKYATKMVINSMRETVEHLVISGWIDNTEKTSLYSQLNRLLEKVKMKHIIGENDRQIIFGNVSWIENHPKIKEALFEKVETKKFEAGKCIFDEGDKSNGIYIIIKGVCDISYIPDENILWKLRAYGELPIVDNILSDNFKHPFNTYLTSGMTMGELSFLTDRQYASKVIADSPCEAYFLSSEVLEEVMEIDSDPDKGLRCRIWKNVSRNMATEILLRTLKFDSEENKIYGGVLTRFYMPDFDVEKHRVENYIRDIVLVEGLVQDGITGKPYTGPCRIPRQMREITFPVNAISAKLLFIPHEETDDTEISFQM